MTIIIILLAVIVYILWKIYQQREREIGQKEEEKFDIEWQKKKMEKFKDYPNLCGKLEGNWLEVFANHHHNGIPLLKLCYMLYFQDSVKIEFSEGSFKFDSLWDASEELLEHLGKYHEGTIVEHEIALATYWQVAAEEVTKLIEASPKKTTTERGHLVAPIEGYKLETQPFTDINRIAALFPKKSNHPAEEITFMDIDGHFPRKSEGSEYVKQKLEKLGL